MTKQEFDEMAALVVRLRKDLELHTDALVKSNAQCAEYLRQNEQLRADVAAVAEELKRDISSLVHAASAERDKLHRDLVEVRAALAATTEQRDSLQRTLDEWSNADTEPHDRVTAEDVGPPNLAPGTDPPSVWVWGGTVWPGLF